MPAELQSSLVVAFSQRNRSQPAPRGVSPGNCAALRSDNGATGAGVCAAVTCPATTRGSAAAPAVAATDLTKPRRDSLFTSAITDSTRDSNGLRPRRPKHLQVLDDRPPRREYKTQRPRQSGDG